MRTILLDCDTLIYEVARSQECPIQWSPSLWTLHAELDPAIVQLDAEVQQIKENLEADEVTMCLSDYRDPWRKRVMPSYKANRKDTRKPIIYEPLREYVHEKYNTFQRPGLEGDDCLGILLTNPHVITGEKIVVSIDKDMQTLPGLHVNLKRARERGEWMPYAVTLPMANAYHMKQAVMGDTTDGYPGCPGIGPVSAAKLLDPYMGVDEFDVAGAWLAIVAAYQKKGLTVDDALMNARVARICRHEDFDYDKKEVKLWNPPN